MMRAVWGIALAAALSSGTALGQSLSFSSKGSDKPITVTAEQGLEWRQNDKLFIARGNAKAVQEDQTVTADQLIAHYRAKPKAGAPGPKPTEGDAPPANEDENGSEVYRVDAVGHVVITSKEETATGGAAVYDFDRKVLVLQGDPVTLTTSDGDVTAHKTLQYWSDDNVAVAEGNALAVSSDKDNPRRIQADKLTAFFRDAPPKDSAGKTTAPGSAKGRDLTYLVGAGNVVLTTRNEIVRGERANYNLDTGMATVEGGVKMTRDNNQLNGGYAVVNVKGGVSRLYGSAAEAKGAGAPPPARVRALLAPKNAGAEPPRPLTQGP